MEWADVYIGLRGARNQHELAGIPTERLTAHRRALGAISAWRNEQTRWVLVRVPNESFAQMAGMSLEATMDFFFDASLRDCGNESRRYRRISDLFQAASQYGIVGPDTGLTFSTAGRTYVVRDARINSPDWDVCTAPVDDNGEGVITYGYPGGDAGQPSEGIRLEFR